MHTEFTFLFKIVDLISNFCWIKCKRLISAKRTGINIIIFKRYRALLAEDMFAAT